MAVKRLIRKSILLSIAAFLAIVSMAMAGIFVVVDRGTVKIHDAKTVKKRFPISFPIGYSGIHYFQN